jgi:NAD-dependent deacetylase
MEFFNHLSAAADLIRPAKNLVVITGAGVSAESGIDTYRGAGGLWDRYDVAEVATGTALRVNPRKVWEFLLLLREHTAEAEPNPGHRAIRALEDRLETVRVITQNIDGLHQAAGSRDVLEIHGNVREARHEASGRIYPLDELDLTDLPPRAPDGGEVLRPNVLYFEEQYDPGIMATAARWVREAQVILVVGTSGMVPTPYYLAADGKQSGAAVVDVNPDRHVAREVFGPGGGIADVFLEGRSGEVLPQLVDLL